MARLNSRGLPRHSPRAEKATVAVCGSLNTPYNHLDGLKSIKKACSGINLRGGKRAFANHLDGHQSRTEDDFSRARLLNTFIILLNTFKALKIAFKLLIIFILFYAMVPNGACFGSERCARLIITKSYVFAISHSSRKNHTPRKLISLYLKLEAF